MKLLKMKNEHGELDCMVKLETGAEMNAYMSMNWNNADLCNHWQAMLNSINTEDDEVIYYFNPDEQEPAVGESFELDNIKYERIA